jgi:hypothetical protein
MLQIEPKEFISMNENKKIERQGGYGELISSYLPTLVLDTTEVL